jgi:hypothetical protein
MEKSINYQEISKYMMEQMQFMDLSKYHLKSDDLLEYATDNAIYHMKKNEISDIEEIHEDIFWKFFD